MRQLQVQSLADFLGTSPGPEPLRVSLIEIDKPTSLARRYRLQLTGISRMTGAKVYGQPINVVPYVVSLTEEWSIKVSGGQPSGLYALTTQKAIDDVYHLLFGVLGDRGYRAIPGRWDIEGDLLPGQFEHVNWLIHGDEVEVRLSKGWEYPDTTDDKRESLDFGLRAPDDVRVGPKTTKEIMGDYVRVDEIREQLHSRLTGKSADVDRETVPPYLPLLFVDEPHPITEIDLAGQSTQRLVDMDLLKDRGGDEYLYRCLECGEVQSRDEIEIDKGNTEQPICNRCAWISPTWKQGDPWTDLFDIVDRLDVGPRDFVEWTIDYLEQIGCDEQTRCDGPESDGDKLCPRCYLLREARRFKERGES